MLATAVVLAKRLRVVTAEAGAFVPEARPHRERSDGVGRIKNDRQYRCVYRATCPYHDGHIVHGVL